MTTWYVKTGVAYLVFIFSGKLFLQKLFEIQLSTTLFHIVFLKYWYLRRYLQKIDFWRPFSKMAAKQACWERGTISKFYVLVWSTCPPSFTLVPQSARGLCWYKECEQH